MASAGPPSKGWQLGSPILSRVVPPLIDPVGMRQAGVLDWGSGSSLFTNCREEAFSENRRGLDTFVHLVHAQMRW